VVDSRHKERNLRQKFGHKILCFSVNGGLCAAVEATLVASASDETVLAASGVDPVAGLPAVIYVTHGIAELYPEDLGNGGDVNALLVTTLRLIF